jgi:head-tail adaptor
MQDTAEDAMPDSAAVSRKTLTSDGQGGFTATWATASTVDCRVEAATRITPAERLVAERVAPRKLYRVTVPYDADVIAADRIVVSGTTYEVLGPFDGGAWMLTKKVSVVEA